MAKTKTWGEARKATRTRARARRSKENEQHGYSCSQARLDCMTVHMGVPMRFYFEDWLILQVRHISDLTGVEQCDCPKAMAALAETFLVSQYHLAETDRANRRLRKNSGVFDLSEKEKARDKEVAALATGVPDSLVRHVSHFFGAVGRKCSDGWRWPYLSVRATYLAIPEHEQDSLVFEASVDYSGKFPDEKDEWPDQKRPACTCGEC